MNRLPREFLDNVIDREGGYVDHPSDRGGPTKYGITLKTLRMHRDNPTLTRDDVRELTASEAREIYEDVYWFDSGLSDLPVTTNLSELLFDMAVNHGPGRTIKILQRVLGVREDGDIGPVTRQAMQDYNKCDLFLNVVRERILFYGRIVRNDLTQGAFISGWLNRTDHFLGMLL